MSEEEVRRVTDSLDAIEAIEDRGERIRAMSQVMAAQIKRNEKWAKERRDLVFELRDADMSIRKIAAEVGTSPSTVQSILSGYTGSGIHRPRKKAAKQPPTE
jgi:AraC-like DNA-binding protein